MNETFLPKTPQATPILTMDFTTRLAGRTIVSAVWSILDEDGNAQSSFTLKGPIDTTGAPLVRQQVQGGALDRSYLHHCEVTTNTGEVVVGVVSQAIRADA